mmetsp:Transcript_25767/g.48728  ORF Transcript_25767/g.48728 Transcript_25767/m.48728 type:complete len:87 (+) Transcript_25767:281-541(+)
MTDKGSTDEADALFGEDVRNGKTSRADRDVRIPGPLRWGLAPLLPLRPTIPGAHVRRAESLPSQRECPQWPSSEGSPAARSPGGTV